MRREFLINIFLLIAINFIIKPFYIFGVETQFQNLVGIQNYGLYFDYFSFVMLFQLFNDAGLQNWNTQHLAKHEVHLPTHLKYLFRTKLFVSLVFFLAMLGISVFLGKSNLKLLIGVGLNLVLSTTFMLIRSTISGMGMYRSDSWLSSLDKLLMILFIGIYIYVPLGSDINIYGFVYLQSAALVIASIIGIFILLKNCKGNNTSEDIHLSISKILKLCWPYVWILVFMTFYTRMDAVLLSHWIDDNHYQTGIYAACFRFFDAANMATFIFGSLLFAMFSRNISDHKVLSSLTDLGFRWSLVISVIISLSLIFWGEVLMKLLLPIFDLKYIGVLDWLMVSFIFATISSIFNSLIMASGQVFHLNTYLGMTCIINIVLNLFLIPKFGAMGAAVASCMTQGILLLFGLVASKKIMNIFLPYRTVMSSILFVIFSMTFAWIVKKFVPFHWAINIFITCTVVGVVASLVHLINKNEIRSLFSTNGN